MNIPTPTGAAVATRTAPAKKQKKSFAQGTTLFPVPLSGGPLNYSAGNVTPLTPIAKTGFLGRLRYNFSGTIKYGTAGASAYTVALWKIIQNYTLQNSLNFPYRSMSGDDLWFWQQVNTPFAGGDPVTQSANFLGVDPTNTGATQNFSFSLTDEIWHNDGVNFSRYLLSAMTTSNDLSINLQWAQAIGGAGVSALVPVGDSAVVQTYTCSCKVSAEFLTVPNPNEYEWPRRNLIQQIIADPSFNSPRAGVNSVNLTPIQGPEFLGIGIQVVDAGTPVGLIAATSPITEIDILVNGSIPLYQFTGADLIAKYERAYRRSPTRGFLYLDFSNDLGLVNAMSHTHRKVLSTSKYSQITMNVTLGGGFSGAAGSYINVWKRTQQAYGNNS